MDRAIRKVAVVGTGVLGTQIAVQAAASGYETAAFDPDPESFSRNHDRLASLLGSGEGKPLFTTEEWNRAGAQVLRSGSLEKAVAGADLVIEAVPERLELKREVFEQMDTLARPGAILATNSSSIPVSRIETATNRPERCVNTHFYYPALGTSMVDVMGGTRTTAKVLATVKDWVRSIGCVPLTVNKEILGFCFNRVWRAIKKETLFMWAEGCADFRDMDRAWMIFSGMKRGPFGIMDNVGLDVVRDIEMVYYNESKDPRDHPPKALEEKISRGELGRKTGKGFYTYPNPEYEDPDFLKP